MVAAAVVVSSLFVVAAKVVEISGVVSILAAGVVVLKLAGVVVL